MPKRSNRLIFCYWDDRDEGLLDWSRRNARELEFFKNLPPLFGDAIGYPRRTIYTYGKRVRALGLSRQGLRPNNPFFRTTSRYRPGRGRSFAEPSVAPDRQPEDNAVSGRGKPAVRPRTVDAAPRSRRPRTPAT